jgi:hypothetical protein
MTARPPVRSISIADIVVGERLQAIGEVALA